MINRFKQDFLTAVSFLTIIPIPMRCFKKKYSLSKSLRYFPLVGFLIGITSLLCVSFFKDTFSERLINLLLVLFPIIFTAGLHLDGVADFFDGFFQGKDKEDILRIMKDSHIGVWGVTSVIFCILLKWELLMILPAKNMSYLLALTLSRWTHVFLSYHHTYARPKGGLGKLIVGKIKIEELFIASIFAGAVSLWLGWKGICVYLGVLCFVWLMGLVYKKKLGGVTGDIIGATGEMTEIIVFYVLIMLG